MPASVARTGDDTDPTRNEIRPAWLAAGGTVAAVYVYFLIFAQFGFLRLLQQSAAAPSLKPIMAAMGAGGLAASALVAWLHTEAHGRWWLVASLGVAGAAAGLALAMDSTASCFVAAALTGIGTGGASVALAPLLRRATGAAQLGRCLGWGTGIAYGTCNLPMFFNAEPRGQAMIAVVAAALGIVATFGLTPRFGGPTREELSRRTLGIGVWTLAFLLLVWLDSAAFYVIQHTPVLRENTWTGNTQLGVNAVVHLVAAVVAGWMLDRRWAVGVIIAAALLLGTACLLLGGREPAGAVVALFYASGVSLYSTALVYYPALSGRATTAAIVYGVAGWIGSALGISMAEKLQAIPTWFLGVVTGPLLLVRFTHRQERGKMNKD
ncbi:MAG TPA: hypothetical protein VFJ90_11685 [Candidatus Didemnitutus sp.]|nr:hypothetical protein [Candidatus Didemnitutus sp.]